LTGKAPLETAGFFFCRVLRLIIPVPETERGVSAVRRAFTIAKLFGCRVEGVLQL